MSNKNEKNHYRKVFKSDHLGKADLEDLIEEGHNLVFTISYVQQFLKVKVAGKDIAANIAFFKESIKPLVLNATNSKVMKELTSSPFVEDWKNVTVQLYIDQGAKLKGEVVGGVRINPNFKVSQRKEITPQNTKMWENAKAAYLRDGNFEKVLAKVDISLENQELIIKECFDV